MRSAAPSSKNQIPISHSHLSPIYDISFSLASLFPRHCGPFLISSTINGNNNAQTPPQNVYVQPSPHAPVIRSITLIMMAASPHLTRFVHAVAPELRDCKISIFSVIVVFRIPIDVPPRNTPRISGTAMCAFAWIVQPHATTQTTKRLR